MLFFAIHNKALSDKICVRLFLVECPIESCYVCRGFQLSFLAKKAPGGRSWYNKLVGMVKWWKW